MNRKGKHLPLTKWESHGTIPEKGECIMTEEERKEKRKRRSEIEQRSAAKIYKTLRIAVRKDSPTPAALEQMRESTGEPIATYMVRATGEKLQKEGWL